MNENKSAIPTVPKPQNIPSNIQEQEEQKMILEWLEEEIKREQQDWLPARPLAGFGLAEGEVEIEDPERVVLFEDIKNYLFQFTYQDVKEELVYRFLEFLGVYVPPRVSSNDPYSQQRAQDIEDVTTIFDVITTKHAHNPKKFTDPLKIAFVK